MSDEAPESNVISLATGRAEPTTAQIDNALKAECLGVIDDLRGRVERGEIEAFTFIGFSSDLMSDVTVFTTGTMRHPAHTVGAMEMHKQCYMAAVEEAVNELEED